MKCTVLYIYENEKYNFKVIRLVVMANTCDPSTLEPKAEAAVRVSLGNIARQHHFKTTITGTVIIFIFRKCIFSHLNTFINMPCRRLTVGFKTFKICSALLKVSDLIVCVSFAIEF